MKLNKISKKGFGLIDIIIASSVLGIVIFSLIQVGILSIRLSQMASEKTEAGFLVQEAAEAIRFLRDESWNGNIETLNLGSEYYIFWDGFNYALSSETPELINNKFFRSITVYDVLRDAQDDIQESGITDPLTKKVVVTVSWLYRGATTTEGAEFYITDLFSN